MSTRTPAADPSPLAIHRPDRAQVEQLLAADNTIVA
jgi:hypothetical protein